ncbi:hypothetical protein GOODEAATRI_006390 [Goodea atripinnis]|uniref:Resistance to inhibitors of cholinesterase protein 3 N-terminal domain-containing protein n=1 Tax=Goodea atripinnis TaxID=208336 RepID=A0ABV0N8E5_9TELE
MVLSTSQQVALAFTAVLFTFVVLPRLFGVGGGTAAKETKFDPRYNRKGEFLLCLVCPGPGASRGQPSSMNSPGSHQSADNVQQMKKRMEQEMKSDKYKSNNNKGYVFTLMPLYAIGVGVFAAYNVKSVAQEQKNEIMSQLQTIRYLMKKRGMDCPPLNGNDISRGRNLEELIESIGASQTSTAADTQPSPETVEAPEKVYEQPSDGKDEAAAEGEEMMELRPEKPVGEEEDVEAGEMNDKGEDNMEGLEPIELESASLCETNIEEIYAEQPVSGLRRRNRPE